METWIEKIQIIVAEKTVRYQIIENDKLLSFRQVIQLWKENPNFRQFYNQLLYQAPFKAFFWEHPPLVANNLDQDYEFVLVKNNSLESIRPDRNTFANYFNSDRLAVSFPNRRGDAQLVVPCPNQVLDYAHLANFVRQAPPPQIDRFWKLLGEVLEKRISEDKLWLSTSGLGVSWLHIRLDQRPKYYTHLSYRQL